MTDHANGQDSYGNPATVRPVGGGLVAVTQPERPVDILEDPYSDAITFTVYGAPRTKKTHNQLVKVRGKPRVLASKAWRQWAKAARIEPRSMGWPPPLEDRPYNIAATFYRDANRGDAVGYYQGLADLLEKRGVISNDKWLVSWDGSRLKVDRENPRVEVVLTRGA